MKPFKHPLGESAASELRHAIERVYPGHIVALVGLGGVGKSTVVGRVCSDLYGSSSLWPDNVTPVARVMAMLPDKAYFNSLGFVISIRREISFPNISWLQFGPSETAWAARKIAEVLSASLILAAGRNNTEAGEWACAADLARLCRTEVLVVEHANALLRNHRDKKPAQHLQNLMSWGERTGTKIVLLGVETLPDLWNSSVELSRRMTKIWLPPYGAGSDEELRVFCSVFAQMLEDYESDRAQVLRKIRMIHDSTGGIIGQCRRLLEDASKHGTQRITVDSLRGAIQHPDSIAQIWESVSRFQRISAPAAENELMRAKARGLALG
jgi:hypothetical protein